MKKQLIFAFHFLFFITNVFCQHYYDFGNQKDFDHAIRLEIIDSESSFPISNSIVTLYDEYGSLITKLKPDNNGIVIIFDGAYQPPSATRYYMKSRNYKIKVTSDKYLPYDIEIDNNEKSNDRKQSMIQFTDLHFFSSNNWSDLNAVPNRDIIAQHISMRKYRLIDGYRINYYWNSPGLFEYRIELKRIRSDYNDRY